MMSDGLDDAHVRMLLDLAREHLQAHVRAKRIVLAPCGARRTP